MSAQNSDGRFDLARGRGRLPGRDAVDRLARQSPARLAIGVFAFVVAVFTALLSLPAATATGNRAPFVDALFTATSAVCVTGLTTVPTGTYWSTLGLVIILVGMQIGGLGVMTLASLLGLAVSRRIGLTQRLLVSAETKTGRLGEVGSLLRIVVLTSAGFEIAIAVVLIPRFAMLGESWGDATWYGVFYAVSAFNNAGFVPTEEGLDPFVSDWWVLLPIIVGVFVGSLGFPALLNLLRLWRTPRRWSLHAKLTLTTSVVLVVFGSVVVAAFEWTNPRTFAPLDWDGTLLASLFAGVMPRSGGFSTVNVGEMYEGTWLLNDALMFVGGGSASTAGGIKVTTFAVLGWIMWAEARGDPDVVVFERRVPQAAQRQALTVALLAIGVVIGSTMLLLATSPLGRADLMFEVI